MFLCHIFLEKGKNSEAHEYKCHLITSDNVNVYSLFLSLLHYRIQPLHLFVMCLTISLVSLVQWGPYWFPFLETLTDCKMYWWANVLLISNLIPVNEIVSLTKSNSDFSFNIQYFCLSRSAIFLNILFINLSPVFALDVVLVS